MRFDFIRMLVIFMIISLFSSCFNPDKTPIPFTHLPLSALWTKYIDRNVLYGKGFYEFNYENLINIRTRIYPGHATFNSETKGIVYQNYSTPFTLQIIPENIDKNIIKFEIIKCDIINKNEQIKNILDLSIENKVYFPSWISHDRHRSRTGNNKYLTDKNEIIVEKAENEYIENYYIHFNNIPINYEIDFEIILYYEIDIYFENEIKTYIFENNYNRIIEEQTKVGWKEITLEEYINNR